MQLLAAKCSSKPIPINAAVTTFTAAAGGGADDGDLLSCSMQFACFNGASHNVYNTYNLLICFWFLPLFSCCCWWCLLLLLLLMLLSLLLCCCESAWDAHLLHTHSHWTLKFDRWQQQTKWKSCCDKNRAHRTYTHTHTKRTYTIWSVYENKLLKATTQKPHPPTLQTSHFPPLSLCLPSHTHILPNKLQWHAGYNCHINWKEKS